MGRRIAALVAVVALGGAATTGLHAWGAYTSARWVDTATFTLNRSSVTNVSASQAAAAIQTAMNAWNNAGANVTLALAGGDTNASQLAYDGVNAIFFRQASSGAIATNYTWWDGSNRILDSDVVFWNSSRVFATSSTGCSGAYYIEDIAAHELGHGLGLDHSYFVDSAGATATMYPSVGTCDVNFRSLSSDDVAGVQSVYGASSTKGLTGDPSPDGTTVPGASQVVDNLGAVWTIGASGAILRNGLQAAGGWGWTIIWTSSTIYVLGGDNNWWRWTGSGWVNSGPQQPGGTTPGGNTSPDGTTVPGAAQIVDNFGAVWTIGPSGGILRSGLQAAGGWGWTILWTNSTIHVLGGDNNWWRWMGSGWVNSGPQQPGGTTPGGNTSPDGTTVPGATQIVDNFGAVWTIGPSSAILRSGLQAAGGWGSTILWTSSTIYVRGGDNNWWRWTGSGWVNSGSQQPGGTTPGGTEWFVASGSFGNGSSANPFGRIQDALNAAQAGDTVTVRPGTYNEALATVRAGTEQLPITLRSASGRGSVIVTHPGRVLTIGQPYFVVDGLTLDGQYGVDDLVRVTSAAHYLQLKNSELRRSGLDLIDMGAPTGVLIAGCLIHHALNPAGGRSDAHGIVTGPIHGLTIRDSEIHTFSGDGVQVDSGRAAPGWTGLTIERTHIWLAPLPAGENGFPAGVAPGENAVDTKASPNFPRSTVIIRDVVAHGFRNGLITNMAAFNLKENVDVTVDGVTVFDSEIAFRLRGAAVGGAWVAIKNAVIHDVLTAFRYEDNIQNLRIWNNTVGLNVTQAFQAASSVSTGLEVRNLLTLGTNAPEAAHPSNLAVGASAFTNAAAGDYTLSPTSPAIDVGAVMPEVTIDRIGVTRPQRGGPDVGAYERP